VRVLEISVEFSHLLFSGVRVRKKNELNFSDKPNNIFLILKKETENDCYKL